MIISLRRGKKALNWSLSLLVDWQLLAGWRIRDSYVSEGGSERGVGRNKPLSSEKFRKRALKVTSVGGRTREKRLNV